MDRFAQFNDSITSIYRFFQNIKKEEMKRWNLKGIHVMCLYHLQLDGDLSVGELAKCTMEDKAAVSRCLDELRQKGLVINADSQWYRCKLGLTQQGHELASSMIKRVNELLEVGSKGLDDSQREQLYASLTLIRKNLNEIMEK